MKDESIQLTLQINDWCMSPLPLTEKDSSRNLSFFMSENSWHSYFTLEISVAHTSTRSHLLSNSNLVVYSSSTFTSPHIWFDIFHFRNTNAWGLWSITPNFVNKPVIFELFSLNGRNTNTQIWLKCFRWQYCLCLLWCTGWLRHCTDCWRIASFPSDSLWPYFIHALL